MPAATRGGPPRGPAAAIRTPGDSTPTGVPLPRSRVNGRFLSTSPPPTATARLHPATIRVSAPAAYTIFSNVAARASRIWSVSPNVRGGVGAEPWPPDSVGGVLTARYVRTRSSVAELSTRTRTVIRLSFARSPVYAGLDALAIGAELV